MSVASLLDAGDLENRQLLTVALALVVTGLVLELVDTNLGALGVLEHLTGHRDLGKRGGIGSDGGTVDDQCDRQRHLRAGLGVELLDLDDVSDRDFVLLAAGLDDCIGRHGYVYLFFFESCGRRATNGARWVLECRPKPGQRAWRQLVKGT